MRLLSLSEASIQKRTSSVKFARSTSVQIPQVERVLGMVDGVLLVVDASRQNGRPEGLYSLLVQPFFDLKVSNFERPVLGCIDASDSERRHIVFFSFLCAFFRIRRDLQGLHSFAQREIKMFKKQLTF